MSELNIENQTRHYQKPRVLKLRDILVRQPKHLGETEKHYMVTPCHGKYQLTNLDSGEWCCLNSTLEGLTEELFSDEYTWSYVTNAKLEVREVEPL